MNKIALDHLEIKKAREEINANSYDSHSRVLKRLRIIRYSNWQGLKNARKQNPRIWNGRIIAIDGVSTLCVVESARKKDITHNKSVRRALRKINPDVVEFADVDRLGREYWEAARNSFEAMGMRVEFKDEGWRPDMHLRPATTKIDLQTQALKDDVCVVHIKDIDKSKIITKNRFPIDHLRRVRNHVLIKKEKLALLGIEMHKLTPRVIGAFGNAFSEIVQIANGSARSYILSDATAPP